MRESFAVAFAEERNCEPLPERLPVANYRPVKVLDGREGDIVVDAEDRVVSRPPKDPVRAEWARRARLERFKHLIPGYEAAANSGRKSLIATIKPWPLKGRR